MELKEIIVELREVDPGEGIPFAVYERRQKVLAAAVEALALVAWAEEHEVEVSRWNGAWLAEVTRPMAEVEGETITFYYESDTILGAIRAAKEAYENQ